MLNTGFMGIEYSLIKKVVDECIEMINDSFNAMIKLLSSSALLEKVLDNSVVDPVIAAIKASALTLCVLFFLIDFFEKTLNLQWVKWENVMMLFIKLVFAKVIIEMSPTLCEMIYDGFSSIAKAAFEAADVDSFSFIEDGEYEMFWLSESEADKLRGINDEIGFLDFSPIFIKIKVSIMSFIYALLMIVIQSIILGRVFELSVYTIIAPLPLSTLASDGLKEVGKSFLKSYAAVSIQALVILIMIIAYTLLFDYIPDFNSFSFLMKILLFALAIMQSGSWAKRICNAM